MGLPMARRLAAAGFETWGFDVRPVDDFGDFAPRMVADPAAFGARCDTLLTVVRDTRQTHDCLFDVQAVMAGPNPPRRVILCSTLPPRVSAQVAERLPAGTAILDAPMSGAPFRAENGTLTFMVGADDTEFAACRPLFDAMGADIHHLGGPGAGLACKVLNNLVAATCVVAVRTALAEAPGLGVTPERLRAVMETASGGTWFGTHFDAIDWSRQGYDPANTIGILEKDVTAYLDGVGGDEGAQPLARAVIDALRALTPMDEEPAP